MHPTSATLASSLLGRSAKAVGLIATVAALGLGLSACGQMGGASGAGGAGAAPSSSTGGAAAGGAAAPMSPASAPKQ